MAGYKLDYRKLKADKHITVWMGPTSGVTGVQNLGKPTADEINNTGGVSAMENASVSISWNDFDLGIQASERNTDPSLADDSTYEDFGQENMGGSASFYYPKKYDDNSNKHSIMYDMLDQPWTEIDIIERIDGNKKNDTPAANGDFVLCFRTMTDGETNSMAGADALRRTVNFLSQGEMAVYTIVGPHVLSEILPTTDPWAAGKAARIRVSVQDRDYTNAVDFSSSDPSVVQVYPGGFYKVVGAAGATADILIEDEAAGTTKTVAVTVTA